MKIITVNGTRYIDDALQAYISNIWSTFKTSVIQNGTNIFFLKNATIPRITTDYSGTDIRRVIKKEKAHYVILKQFSLPTYPKYYDATLNTICEDDDNQKTRVVVYNMDNLTLENKHTIEAILDFHDRGQSVIYIDEVKVNESLNNGFILDNESYTSIKQLVDSGSAINEELAYKMIVNSDLKNNWQWIAYIYFNKGRKLIHYDTNGIVAKYIEGAASGNSFRALTENVDTLLKHVTDLEVKEALICMVRQKFIDNMSAFLSNEINTNDFKLDDFNLNYNGK